MFFAGYVGAVGLFSVAGVLAAKATNQGRYASQLESALINDLPDVEGKTAYVALECMGSPISFSLLPESTQVLLGRVNIQKHTSHFDLGIGSTISRKGDLVITASPRSDVSEIQIGFPEKPALSSPSGPVFPHHLDLATWIGATKKVNSYTPKEAAIPLRDLDLQPDLLADEYRITVEGFEENRIFMFVNATKRENAIHANPPSKDLPFLVTTDNPKVFVLQEHLRADRTKRNAIISGLGAVALGSGARTRQLFNQMQLYHEFDFLSAGWRWDSNSSVKPIGPKQAQMFACFGVCVVSTLAALHFGLFRRPSAVQQD